MVASGTRKLSLPPIVVPPPTANDLIRRGDWPAVQLLAQRRLAENPRNRGAMTYLSFTLTEQGCYEDAIIATLGAESLGSDGAIAVYNRACAFARLGLYDQALDTLQTSIDLGYRDLRHMSQDEDLELLREHPRFLVMLAPLLEPADEPPLPEFRPRGTPVHVRLAPGGGVAGPANDSTDPSERDER